MFFKESYKYCSCFRLISEKLLFLATSTASNKLFLVACDNAPDKGRFSILDFKASKLFTLFKYELNVESSIEATKDRSILVPSIDKELPFTNTCPI